MSNTIHVYEYVKDFLDSSTEMICNIVHWGKPKSFELIFVLPVGFACKAFLLKGLVLSFSFNASSENDERRNIIILNFCIA